MSDITTFTFSPDSFDEVKKYHFGRRWPVVYLLENGKEIYIGESVNVYNRSKQHFENAERRKLKKLHVITDEEYNKSAALDIESMLIQYIAADEKFLVQNANRGLSNHNYYDREKYKAKFELIWEELRHMSLVQNELVQIRNSQLFKYSPYKSLTDDQLDITRTIVKMLRENIEQSIIVDGSPGTGKTILAIYLMKFLSESKDFQHLKIGFVVPMQSLRKTIKRVFSHVKGLRSTMVIGPNDVVKDSYDLVIVDEAHRLMQRKNLTNYASYDAVNKKLGLDTEATQLDWIIQASKQQIFFYDENQSVRPADVHAGVFSRMEAQRLGLKKQVRVKGGDRYIDFINNFFDLEISECNFEDYDFKIYSSAQKMIDDIRARDKEYGLGRVVAGYAWPWKTKKGGDYDIQIGDVKLKWNSTTDDWVNSKDAVHEVGCIHTVQGYDLNYAGVIIGPELRYDSERHEIIIDKDRYEDFNGKRSIQDPKELKKYILNIYKTLLTRGIYGTYVYVVDDALRQFLQDSMDGVNFE